MALHNLKIVVVDGGRAGSYKSKNAGGNKKDDKKKYKDSPLYKALHAKQTIKEKFEKRLEMTPAQVFAMDMGLRIASQLVKQSANYFISDIGRKNGDSNYQAVINRQIETITDPLSVAGGILSGAAAGSMFGPGGAMIGGLIGGASSGISVGFKYAERERAYAHEMFKENNSQMVQLSRTNFSALTGRVR